MKKKLGTSLIIGSLLLNSLPLTVLGEELSGSHEGIEELSLPSDDTTADSAPTEESPAENNEQLEEQNNSLEEVIVEEDPSAEKLTEEDFSAETDDYLVNENLQQAQRDKAMEMLHRVNLVSPYALTPQQAFINLIAPSAKRLADEYNLYASVMIAQAILESGWGTSALSLSPNHNLFGIKGEYQGQSVTMYTQEEVNGNMITIKAKFRKYPNYAASLKDNAHLLRNGISSDASFYKGTWKENTTSYRDATAWLTGRYATDSSYAAKLNSTIKANNLTQYDYPQTNPNDDLIQSSTPMSKGMKVVNSSYFIYTAPYNTPESYRIGQLKNSFNNGERVEITDYAITARGIRTYHIKNCGWVDYRALGEFETIASKTELNQTMAIADPSFYVYNLPYNTDGAHRLYQIANKYTTNHQVFVTAKAITTQGVGVYHIQDIGWVDQRALKNVATIASEVSLNKTMAIANPGYFIYNLPYNTAGAGRIAPLSANYVVNQQIFVATEAVTSQGIRVYHIQDLGWVDYRALKEVATIASETELNKTMVIANTGYFIYNLPYNTAGAGRIAQLSANYKVNQPVFATTEAVTSQGIKVYHIQDLGWVDQRALKNAVTITSEKKMNHTMAIANTGYYIYNLPYNTPGAGRITQLSSKYSVNQQVVVTAEAVTSQGVRVYHIENVGWVDQRGLKNVATIASEKKLNKKMKIASTGYYIYNVPYNTIGAKRISLLATNYKRNQKVTVTAEAVTSQGIRVFYLKDVGWVDHRALK